MSNPYQGLADDIVAEIAALRDDAERYRWLRDQCDPMRRMVIMEQIEGDPGHMLDHHIDKGRCGL